VIWACHHRLKDWIPNRVKYTIITLVLLIGEWKKTDLKALLIV
jgi:hypothetical protein